MPNKEAHAYRPIFHSWSLNCALWEGKTGVGGEVTRLSNMKMGDVMEQTAGFSDSKYLTEGPAL